MALQRLDEAKLVFEKLQLAATSEYLAGYALECAFKAVIVSRLPGGNRPAAGPPTVEWLKAEFGHSLHRLSQELKRRGTPIPRDLLADFTFVSTWDPKDRYVPGVGDVRQAQRFLAAVERLTRWADGRI